jgi:hypothetical protein
MATRASPQPFLDAVALFQPRRNSFFFDSAMSNSDVLLVQTRKPAGRESHGGTMSSTTTHVQELDGFGERAQVNHIIAPEPQLVARKTLLAFRGYDHPIVLHSLFFSNDHTDNFFSHVKKS